MESRRERVRDSARTKLLATTFSFTQIPLCAVLVSASCFVWYAVFPEEQMLELIANLQRCYMIAIGLFIMISAFGPTISVFVKILIRLLFTVWLFSFLLVSTLEQAEQSAYIIIGVIFVGYLEACFDGQVAIKEAFGSLARQSPIVIALGKHSKALTVIAVSVVHAALAFAFRNMFERIFVQM